MLRYYQRLSKPYTSKASNANVTWLVYIMSSGCKYNLHKERSIGRRTGRPSSVLTKAALSCIATSSTTGTKYWHMLQAVKWARTGQRNCRMECGEIPGKDSRVTSGIYHNVIHEHGSPEFLCIKAIVEVSVAAFKKVAGQGFGGITIDSNVQQLSLGIYLC